MKNTLLLLFLFSFSVASAQTEVTTDTVYTPALGGTPVALLKKMGTGFIVYSMDSKQRLISIKENYYRFANGLIAYPDVTVRSADKTMEVITGNKLFDKSGLSEGKVKEFVSRYSAPLPVQQIQRESREEVNPEIK